MRNGGPVEPGVLDALQEVIADAAATGAPLHVVHITSMGLRETPLCLEMIEGARRRGLDVTTEAYPYTAGMTDIGSAIFSEGWQARQGGITFSDLQWAATSERLTADSFARYRRQGGMVAIHSIPEDIVKLAMGNQLVAIASDGILEEAKGEPPSGRRLRRHSRSRHGPPPRGRLLHARAEPLCARAARAQFDGGSAQDDLGAGGTPWHPQQGAHRSGRGRGPCGVRCCARGRPGHV